MGDRLTRLIANLVCPACGGALRRDGNLVRCDSCPPAAVIRDGAVVFGDLGRTAERDWLLRVKERVKSSAPRFYGWLIRAASPVYANARWTEFIESQHPEARFVIDYGSGPLRLHPDAINVDIFPYAEVDLVTAGKRVPLRDGCVGALVSIAVLEHVSDPLAVVAEIARLLEPGGEFFVYVPFMQGVHAAPDDFQRWTPHGLERLFAAFDDVEVTVGAGPTSALVWILQEWFAMLFSFGSKRLYHLLYVAGFVFAPLKFLDALLHRHPMASNIASGYVVRGRKPGLV